MIPQYLCPNCGHRIYQHGPSGCEYALRPDLKKPPTHLCSCQITHSELAG